VTTPAMKKYAALVTAAAALTVVATLFVGSDEKKQAIFWALAVAIPVQMLAFWALQRVGSGAPGFLAAWLGGTLLRLAALGFAGFWVIWQDLPEPGWSLLGLAGLFFVFHLLEVVALRRDEDPT
jgi:hypothetical protein